MFSAGRVQIWQDAGMLRLSRPGAEVAGAQISPISEAKNLMIQMNFRPIVHVAALTVCGGIINFGGLVCACVQQEGAKDTSVATIGVVPGTGQVATKVGDDFEDPNWTCELNLPKSSFEEDNQKREPGALISNRRWYEGAKRGIPDVVQRVATPENGLEGSEGTLLLRSLQTGVPGRLSHKNQQDVSVCDVDSRLGGMLPVSQSPSVVVRVFLPEFDQWQVRQGAHFGFRTSLTTTKLVSQPSGRGRFATNRTVREQEQYWPGMFADFTPAQVSTSGKDEFQWRIRSNPRGYDFHGKAISQAGWWTLGISITPDGRVHYYAKPGVQDLTAADHIVSQTPYSYRAEYFKTFFFNVINGDDGKNWSTPIIIDDPTLYFIAPQQATAGQANPVNR